MANIDPSLTLPPSEDFLPASTTELTGINFNDSFAASNPGELYLSIRDTSGTLSARDSSGAVSGSGTNSFTLSAPYADVAAILNSLTYTAPATPGSDTISFDVWDQGGIETTGTIPITVSSGGEVAETWTGAVSSDWNTPGNWSGEAVPTSGDNVTIPGNVRTSPVLSNAVLSGETITLSQSGTTAASASFNDVTFDSVLQTAGTDNLRIGGTLTIGTHGTLGSGANGTLLVGTDGSAVPIVNDGLIRASAGGRLTFNNGGTVTSATVTMQNNGSISADGGNISLDFAPPPFGMAPPETVTNAGSVGIANGGSLTLNGTFVGNSVSLEGTGALGLQQGSAFSGGSEVSGFGPGDQIDLYAQARGAPLAYSDGILSAGTASAIPLAGSYGLGNFESEVVGGAGNPQIIGYAPGGGPSGIVQPDISAPAVATVAQGSTLSLNGVSISALGSSSDTLAIDAGSGTLYMNGATGSGTHQLTLGPATPDQIDTALATLSYVPAAGATSDAVYISVNPPAPVTTERAIPVTITSGGRDPVLTEPPSEIVAAGGSVAVSGSYSDSFAKGNPGELFVGISDSSGTLMATDALGQAVVGSGTNSIGLSTDYVDVNAILKSLHYTPGTGLASDTIQFDVWNQAGVETTGSTSVTIDAAMSPMSAADFAAAATVSTGGVLSADANTASAGAATQNDVPNPSVRIPLRFEH